MPRSMLRDPDKEASAILFGSKANAVNLSRISEATGIPANTLSNYRRRPSTITLERFALIAKVRGLSGEEIGKVVKILGGTK